ncbi:MAG: response regulator [Candidatus Brocadiae bacterium]|nr:response regulator [Candidatus Brocadiia bacterium]
MADTQVKRPDPDFRSLFESAPGLYLVLDPDLNILAVSDAYLRATMTAREQILGRGIFDVFPDNPADPSTAGVSTLRASLERVKTSLQPDTMAVQKYDIRRPDSEGGGWEERWWSPLNSPVLGADGRLRYLIHRVEDVTEFVKLRDEGKASRRLAGEFRDRAAQMEREVVQRGQELAALNEKLRTMDRVKTRFFANVSHELRTPLTLILGPAENLLRDDAVTPARRHDAETILRNARLLQRHVNDLLDVAKLEAGKMGVEYARFDLARLVRQTASHFQSFASDRGDVLTVEAASPVEVEADPLKIDRVLINLLSNAFKFTPVGGRVRITLRAGSGETDAATVEVADSGPGIPPEFRKAVFERFVQAGSDPNRSLGGTGLGLAIAKEFLELHRGAIEIADAPEGGALFVVTLPLRAPAGTTIGSGPAPSPPPHISEERRVFPEPARPPSPTSPPPSSPLVLVVEDNADMRRYICESLAGGFRTEECTNGKEGLKRAKELLPDLILTDLMLPEMSGEDLVLAVRRLPQLNHVPVVFLTARADDDLRIRLLQEGAQDWLTKPFSAEELSARVGNLVSRKQAAERLEDQLRQAQKMEAVGRLAGGVAHDFNNLLTAILGYAETAIDKIGSGHSASQDIEEVRRAGQRAATLTQQLLAYSRKQVLRLEPVDLNLVVQTMDRLLARLIGEDIRLKTHLAKDPLWVNADRGQLEQVIANLAVNARDAMSAGGNLTIETASAVLDAPYAEAAGGLKAGVYATLAMTDNGHGIPAEILPRIFEPFFTTKEPGKGTGLGLSTSYGIVKQTGGHISVYSEPGQGTTFRIYLPLSSEIPGEAPIATQDPPAARGGETILLVEDEPQVRSIARTILSRLGYQVLAAPDGMAAIDLATAHEGPLDLLLSDVVMPGLGGVELADRLMAVRPGLRVLFMSGYSAHSIVQDGFLDPKVNVLEKPFTSATLSAKVREVLDRR